MKIIQISDCHLFADTSKVGYNNINPFCSLERVLAQCKEQKPEVLLVTGDISGDGTDQSYQHFARLVRETNIGCRIGVIPGNHDNQKLLQANVLEEYLWLHQSRLVLPNQWHIHLLDTQYRQTIGQISENQLTSLTEYVQQQSNEFHLIAAHHHPIPCGGWMDKHEWTNRQAFNALVAKHSSIKGVIYGHIHTAIETRIGQCLYMACPSTCWQFANQESFSTTDLKPGYRVINLLENGQINTSIQRLKE
jgi:Icc protein